jgi:hypothetical protein
VNSDILTYSIAFTPSALKTVEKNPKLHNKHSDTISLAATSPNDSFLIHPFPPYKIATNKNMIIESIEDFQV